MMTMTDDRPDRPPLLPPVLTVRSFGVACFLLGKGYRLLGGEDYHGRVIYRFDVPPGNDGLREYATAKARLDAIADAVMPTSGGAA
jgi:hypothetical protein